VALINSTAQLERANLLCCDFSEAQLLKRATTKSRVENFQSREVVISKKIVPFEKSKRAIQKSELN